MVKWGFRQVYQVTSAIATRRQGGREGKGGWRWRGGRRRSVIEEGKDGEKSRRMCESILVQLQDRHSSLREDRARKSYPILPFALFGWEGEGDSDGLSKMGFGDFSKGRGGVW